MPAPVETVQAVQQATETATSMVDGGVAAAGGAGSLMLAGLLWLMKRVFGITIPRLSNDFRESLKAQLTEHREALRELRALDREDAKQARADFKEALRDITTGIEAKLDRLSTAVERMDQTLRGQGK